MHKNTKLNIRLLIALIVVSSLYILVGLNIENYQYFLYRRIPRLVVMILSSYALVVSTGLFQTISRNAILTPDLLGYNSLYILIQTTLAYLLGTINQFFNNPLVNFFLTTVIMVVLSSLIYQWILKKTEHNILTLMLIGTILNTFFRSLSSFFQLLIDPNEFSILQNKLIASINSINTKVILIGIVAIAMTIPWILKKLTEMDVIALGEDEAINLGVDVQAFNRQAFIVIGILISVATSLIGPITFLGLIAMNIARRIVDDYRTEATMSSAVIIAAILLVTGQFMIERFLNFSINISVLLNLIGGIYMIVLLTKER